MKGNYDYSKTMMMKILLSEPDRKGGSKVLCNFESALEVIKQVDNITLGCKKIIYLVGWQYLGHDDKYPAFFEVNEYLKRPCDDKAIDSLMWLIQEGKKYNTTVSLHINITDAYPNSPLWQEYLDNDLILKNGLGKPKVTGVWGGEKAYQIVHNKEFESGYFSKRVNQLLELFPPKTLDTIHIDAFFVRRGKGVSVSDEKLARLEMVNYFKDKGIDVTSEFIYREGKLGYRWHHGYSDVVGVINAIWNPVYSRKTVLGYPANVLAGNYHCKALTPDKSIGWLVYGNIWGEDIFKLKDWQDKFIKEFATYNLPYFFLNNYKRIKIKGVARTRKLIHSGGVVSSIINKTISQDSVILKRYQEVFLPIDWLKDTYALYTEVGGAITRRIEAESVKVMRVTQNGESEMNNYTFSSNTLALNSESNSFYKVVVTKRNFSAVDNMF